MTMWRLCNPRECECQHSKTSIGDAELECHLPVAKPKEITLGIYQYLGEYTVQDLFCKIKKILLYIGS